MERIKILNLMVEKSYINSEMTKYYKHKCYNDKES
jgi:hypothetical protein